MQVNLANLWTRLLHLSARYLRRRADDVIQVQKLRQPSLTVMKCDLSPPKQITVTYAVC